MKQHLVFVVDPGPGEGKLRTELEQLGDKGSTNDAQRAELWLLNAST